MAKSCAFELFKFTSYTTEEHIPAVWALAGCSTEIFSSISHFLSHYHPSFHDLLYQLLLPIPLS